MCRRVVKLPDHFVRLVAGKSRYTSKRDTKAKVDSADKASNEEVVS